MSERMKQIGRIFKDIGVLEAVAVTIYFIFISLWLYSELAANFKAPN